MHPFLQILHWLCRSRQKKVPGRKSSVVRMTYELWQLLAQENDRNRHFPENVLLQQKFYCHCPHARH